MLFLFDDVEDPMRGQGLTKARVSTRPLGQLWYVGEQVVHTVVASSITLVVASKRINGLSSKPEPSWFGSNFRETSDGLQPNSFLLLVVRPATSSVLPHCHPCPHPHHHSITHNCIKLLYMTDSSNCMSLDSSSEVARIVALASTWSANKMDREHHDIITTEHTIHNSSGISVWRSVLQHVKLKAYLCFWRCVVLSLLHLSRLSLVLLDVERHSDEASAGMLGKCELHHRNPTRKPRPYPHEALVFSPWPTNDGKS